jgi:hypothetical protein
MKDLWIPIEELRDLYHPNLLLHAPDLMDGAANPDGVSPGYWQDLGMNGDKEPGAWIAAGYDMCNDCFTTVECNPTHFMVIEGPNKT